VGTWWESGETGRGVERGRTRDEFERWSTSASVMIDISDATDRMIGLLGSVSEDQFDRPTP
jgi:hypothetical protein